MASCVGGMDMRDERRALDRGAHIVVATPGRLRDHIMRGSIDLGQIRAVVLDEADEMLDLGFKDDLEFILGRGARNPPHPDVLGHRAARDRGTVQDLSQGQCRARRHHHGRHAARRYRIPRADRRL